MRILLQGVPHHDIRSSLPHDLIFYALVRSSKVVCPGGTRHIGVHDGLASEVILRVKRDPYRDIFWIVTTNSLAYMDADYNAVTIHKFPDPNNFDLYENSRGDV